MHPLNKKYFGPNNGSMSIRYYNGDALVTGYVYKQLGSSHYIVSDGVHLKSVRLTQDVTTAKYLTGELTPPNSDFSIVDGLATITATKGGTTFYLWKVTAYLAYTTAGTTDLWAIGSAPNGEMLIGGIATLTLGTLSMSSKRYKAGDAFSVYIRGITPGSTVTATSSDGTPLVVSGLNLHGTFPTVGTPTITFVETLGSATGSPKTSTYQVIVSADDTLVSLSISPTTALQGKAYFGAVQNKTAGSILTAVASDGTTLTVYGGLIHGVFNTTGAHSVTITETLGNQSLDTVVTITV